jgi:hypothetical protein
VSVVFVKTHASQVGLRPARYSAHVPGTFVLFVTFSMSLGLQAARGEPGPEYAPISVSYVDGLNGCGFAHPGSGAGGSGKGGDPPAAVEISQSVGVVGAGGDVVPSGGIDAPPSRPSPASRFADLLVAGGSGISSSSRFANVGGEHANAAVASVAATMRRCIVLMEGHSLPLRPLTLRATVVPGLASLARTRGLGDSGTHGTCANVRTVARMRTISSQAGSDTTAGHWSESVLTLRLMVPVAVEPEATL